MRRFHPALLSISLLSFLFVCCSTERAFFLLFRCASSSSSYKRVSDHLFTAGKRGKKNGSSTRFSMSLSPSTLLPFGLVLFRLVFFFIFFPPFLFRRRKCNLLALWGRTAQPANEKRLTKERENKTK